MEFRCAATARLLLRSSSTSRRLLLNRIENLRPPSMGDHGTFPPAHANRQERVAWVFARCHCCHKHAIDRRAVACMNTGVGLVVLMCSTCPARCGRRVDGCHGPGWLRGGRRVLLPKATGPVRSPATHGTPLARAIALSADLLAVCRAARVARVFSKCPLPYDSVHVAVELHLGDSVLEYVCAADWNAWRRTVGKRQMTRTLEIVEALIDLDREWRAFARALIEWHARAKAEAAAARRAARRR
jgi:hypothetical protein